MVLRVRLRLLVLALVAITCTRAFAGDVVFAVFGDTRPGPNYERLEITRRLAQDIATSGAELLIGTGDYIEGSTDSNTVRAQYQRFFEALLPLKQAGTGPPYFEMPVAFATGNHDVRGSIVNARIFEEYFGARRYSFDQGGCHFIVVDSEVPGQEGTIRAEQWQWLMDDLEQAGDAQFIFVALHRPLFPTGPHIGSSMDVDIPLRDRLHALFVKHKVNAVFCGHEHLYHHSRRDDIDYFITGGGGAPLYARPSEGGFYHYLLVTVEAGKYTVEVRPLAGH
jgi:3',5'-cyclic AMP phosphodiesterase CpdA